MHGSTVDGTLQRLAPILQGLTGNSEDQIDRQIGNGPLHARQNPIEITDRVVPFESREMPIGKGLHSQADAVHSVIDQHRQLVGRQIERVGLDGDFRFRGCFETRLHQGEELFDVCGRGMRRSAAAKKEGRHRSGTARGIVGMNPQLPRET